MCNKVNHRLENQSAEFVFTLFQSNLGTYRIIVQYFSCMQQFFSQLESKKLEKKLDSTIIKSLENLEVILIILVNI